MSVFRFLLIIVFFGYCLIIHLINFMLRKIIIRTYSSQSLQRYRAAEEILELIYHHKPSQSLLSPNPYHTSNINPIISQHQLLQPKIIKSLKNLQHNKTISAQIAGEFTSLFKITQQNNQNHQNHQKQKYKKQQKQVISSSSISSIQSIQSRKSKMKYNSNSSNNSSSNSGLKIQQHVLNYQSQQFHKEVNGHNLSCLFSGSVLISQIMKQYYTIGNNGMFQCIINKDNQKNNNNDNKNISNMKAQYFIGRNGIGKTFRFLQLIHLHNLRINYLTKHNFPEIPTKFPSNSNIKFLYFHIQMNKEQQKQQIFQQIVKDFSYDTQIYMKMEKICKDCDLYQFYQNFVQLYTGRGVKIGVVIDSVENLYGIKKKQQKKEIVKNWMRIVRRSNGPVTMISSKNIQYNAKNDPILLIANAKNNNNSQNLNQSSNEINKTILDDILSSSEQLMYVAQCLHFQLQKSRNKIQQFSTKINIIEITNKIVTNIALKDILLQLTHSNISIAVKNTIQIFKKSQINKKVKIKDRQFQNMLINQILFYSGKQKSTTSCKV